MYSLQTPAEVVMQDVQANNNVNINMSSPTDVSNSQKQTSMVGITISHEIFTSSSSLPRRGSELTLDSELVSRNEDDNANVFNPEDIIGLKILVAELRTEMEIQKSRGNKLDSLLKLSQEQNKSLKINNKSLKRCYAQEVKKREEIVKEADAIGRENEWLKLMLNAMSKNGCEASSNDHVDWNTNANGTYVISQAHKKLSLVTMVKDSFRSIPADCQDENEANASPTQSHDENRNSIVGRLCRTFSSSIASSFVSMEEETLSLSDHRSYQRCDSR
jgi:hypothetical protein